MTVLQALNVEGTITTTGGGSLLVGASASPATSVSISGKVNTLSSIVIFADTVTLAATGSLNTNGGSQGAGLAPGGRYSSAGEGIGGTHGGSGGCRYTPTTGVGLTGKPYGSYVYPILPGSRGAVGLSSSTY